MAIVDAGKLFESESLGKTVAHSLGFGIDAGTLICMALDGKRSGAGLAPASISDTKGNTWHWLMIVSSSRACGVAYCRVASAMSTADKVTVDWNGTPSYAWKSAHAFEGASGVPTEITNASGFGSVASVTLDVSGSDWLTFATIMLPDDFGVTATPLNSSISQDNNAHSSVAPWAECFSRNGTTGSTHTIGASFVASLQYAIVGVSFPFLAMPTSPARAVPGLIGV